MRPWGWWSVTTPGVAVTNARFSVQGVAAEQGVKRCGRSVPTPGQAEQASRLRFILMNVFIMTVMALFFFFFLLKGTFRRSKEHYTGKKSYVLPVSLVLLGPVFKVSCNAFITRDLTP